MPIKIIAIDDEPLSLARLKRLSQNIEGADLVAFGNSGLDAIKFAEQHSPDVMLLDINMPGMNGLEAANVIARMPEPPAIIFCTAYDQHAVDAFRSNAVGYLLKPIQFSELNACVLNAKKLNSLQLSNLVNTIDDPVSITVFQDNSRQLVTSSDISYFRAEGKSVVASVNDKEMLIDNTLKSLEEMLEETFLRVHKNALVNRCKLLRLDMNTETGSLVHVDGGYIGINVSRRHLAEVKKCFD